MGKRNLAAGVDLGEACSTHRVKGHSGTHPGGIAPIEGKPMRYMLIMQVDAEAAAAFDPTTADMDAMFATMGAYNEELQKAGVFLSAEGLSDASEGFRVDFNSVPPVVTDGPYAEAREVFTGYWILEVASREEAEHWARKCPLGPGTVLEVRRVNDFADFDQDNEWVTKAQEWRAANS